MMINFGLGVSVGIMIGTAIYKLFDEDVDTYEQGMIFESGYQEGYEEGRADGMFEGFSQGEGVGYKNGYLEGKEEGYNDGVSHLERW